MGRVSFGSGSALFVVSLLVEEASVAGVVWSSFCFLEGGCLALDFEDSSSESLISISSPSD
jgi:hypothetical protein